MPAGQRAAVPVRRCQPTPGPSCSGYDHKRRASAARSSGRRRRRHRDRELRYWSLGAGGPSHRRYGVAGPDVEVEADGAVLPAGSTATCRCPAPGRNGKRAWPWQSGVPLEARPRSGSARATGCWRPRAPSTRRVAEGRSSSKGQRVKQPAPGADMTEHRHGPAHRAPTASRSPLPPPAPSARPKGGSRDGEAHGGGSPSAMGGRVEVDQGVDGARPRPSRRGRAGAGPPGW